MAFGPETVLEDVHLEVEAGEFVCILGPSGAGKSTLLRVLGGLLPAEGEVEIFGEPPEDAWIRLAYVFQTPRLLRWRTTVDNVVVGIELRDGRGNRRDRRRQAHEHLARLAIAELADRRAHVLSGGEQQRVAIARALAVKPDILLMDEPFSALDIRSRNQLRREIVRLWQDSENLTVVFVTHDVDEALMIASRAVVFSGKPTCVVDDVPIDVRHPRRRDDATLLAARSRIAACLGAAEEGASKNGAKE